MKFDEFYNQIMSESTNNDDEPTIDQMSHEELCDFLDLSQEERKQYSKEDLIEMAKEKNSNLE